MKKKTFDKNSEDSNIDLSKEEEQKLKSFFKDVRRKTETETARFRKQPDLDMLYTFIIKREKERRARFDKLLFPLKIFQVISFISISALGASLLLSKKSEIASFFSKFFGAEKSSIKLPTAIPTQSITLLLAVAGAAALILILFSFFTLRTDKTK